MELNWALEWKNLKLDIGQELWAKKNVKCFQISFDWSTNWQHWAVRPAGQTNNSDFISGRYLFIKGLLSFTKEIHYYILQLQLTGGMSLLRLIYGFFPSWTPFNDVPPSVSVKENSSVRYVSAILLCSLKREFFHRHKHRWRTMTAESAETEPRQVRPVV